MKDFIINLYANKYFPIYLGVVIIVLLIAFFVVFFLGKKDQKKIEETQRLNAEAIRKASESSSANVNNTVNSMHTVNPSVVKAPNVAVEKTIAASPQSMPLPNTLVQPNQVTKVVQNAPVTPITMPKVEQAPKVTPSTPVVNQTKPNEVKPVITETISSMPKAAPVVEPVKTNTTQNDLKPIITANETPKVENKVSSEVYHANNNEVDNLKNLASSIDKNLTELENMKQNVTVNNPFNNSGVNNIANTKVVNNIYSSVYVPKKEEPVKEEKIIDDDFDFEETMNIELPKLKDDK